jgi:hypothetical protein
VGRAAEQLDTAGESFLFGSVGEEAKVPDALKGGWEHVKQEPPDELICSQSHRTLLRGFAIPIQKRYPMIINGNDTAIGNRDAVGVTA